MRVKAIKDLVQLSDSELFETIAEGLGYILDNARRLYDGSKQLATDEHFHASIVLRNIGDEEAAKFLILIDAIRCPRQPADRLSKQLSRFAEHLAKGLYSKACYWNATTFGQLQEYLNAEREDFYLDGPTGIDWVFRNNILHRREATLYVDYIETEEGHSWIHPGHLNNEVDSLLFGHRSMALQISEALANCGVSTAAGLDAIAEIWRSTCIEKNTTWEQLEKINWQTLLKLEEKGMLSSVDPDTVGRVHRNWQFPMYELDLSPIKIDVGMLRKHQQDGSLQEF